MIGKAYNIPPQPPVAANTRYFPAGVLTIGVEYRDVDPESLRTTYAGNAEHLAAIEAESPAGGFADEGVSIHVCGSTDGHEYLRFDVFDAEPHYHYIHHPVPRPDGSGQDIVNNIIEFDVVSNGEMLDWVFARLSDRLGPMLIEAGGGDLVDQIDAAVLAPVLQEVAGIAARVQRAHRASGGR